MTSSLTESLNRLCLHYSCYHIRYLGDSSFRGLSSRTTDHLNFPFRQFLANVDSNRNANQVGILELHSRPFVAIIEYAIVTRVLQGSRNLYARFRERLILQVRRNDNYREGSNRRRQPESVLVVILLDARCQNSFDTDSIATHDRRNFLAIFIEDACAHRLRVFLAELEDVSDLDGFAEL